jgi:hypothetical protein
MIERVLLLQERKGSMTWKKPRSSLSVRAPTSREILILVTFAACRYYFVRVSRHCNLPHRSKSSSMHVHGNFRHRLRKESQLRLPSFTPEIRRRLESGLSSTKLYKSCQNHLRGTALLA